MEQNKEVAQEIDEIIATLEEIAADKKQLDTDIDAIPSDYFQENGDKINLGQLSDIPGMIKTNKQKVQEMIDEVHHLEKDIERTKIEMDSGNAGPKIEMFFSKIDSFNQQFEDT